MTSETTPLALEAGGDNDGGNIDPVENVAEVDNAFDELDKPWPATFERSISLLAGPTMDTSLIEKVTMSPKVTPYRAIRAQKSGSGAGYFTPQGRNATAALVHSQEGHQFKQGITKYQSLDFRPVSSAKMPSRDDMLHDFEQREKQAKLYRQKMLKQASAADPNGSAEVHSPGYRRELETELIRTKMKDDSSSNDKSSFAQCIFNMSNILMGVGMLGLPYIFYLAGWVGGFFVTLIFSSIAWRTSILLGRALNGDPRPTDFFDDNPHKSPTVPGTSPSARMRKPIDSFPDIARQSFGKNGNIILCLVLYFELFSCLCIFLVTLGDHLHTLFPGIPMAKGMLYVSFIITIPTALLRTPRLLSYLSAVGTAATICVVLAVLGSAVSKGDISEEVAKREAITDESYHTLFRLSGIPAAFGLIAYTFSGHAIVPSIYVSMENPKDFEKMITYTFAIVTVCCFIVALSGYYMFGSTVDDQITLSLEKASGSNSKSMELLTWLMILTAFSKFTLTAFPLALGIEEILAPFVSSDEMMENVSSLIKIVLIGLALTVAIYVPNFSFLCSLVGLICTMAVSVIFPAAAHLKLFGSHLPLWERVIDLSFIISGSILAIAGTIYTVLSEL